MGKAFQDGVHEAATDSPTPDSVDQAGTALAAMSRPAITAGVTVVRVRG
ncbi:MAG: hypothetical protein JWO76_328 [Nocardioides sp.]|nr:hypothetical protein [Nocardioides sp.]